MSAVTDKHREDARELFESIFGHCGSRPCVSCDGRICMIAASLAMVEERGRASVQVGPADGSIQRGDIVYARGYEAGRRERDEEVAAARREGVEAGLRAAEACLAEVSLWPSLSKEASDAVFVASLEVHAIDAATVRGGR
jgi:hypothetical protein